MSDITPLGDGWYRVEIDDRSSHVAVAQDAGATWVFVDGHVTRVDTPNAGETRVTRKRGEGSVMSPMPATVVTVNAVVGATVTEGQTLIVLEAMKMELPIKAPRAGVVKAIHCAKGDLVQPGVNLLELES